MSQTTVSTILYCTCVPSNAKDNIHKISRGIFHDFFLISSLLLSCICDVIVVECAFSSCISLSAEELFLLLKISSNFCEYLDPAPHPDSAGLNAML